MTRPPVAVARAARIMGGLSAPEGALGSATSALSSKGEAIRSSLLEVIRRERVLPQIVDNARRCAALAAWLGGELPGLVAEADHRRTIIGELREECDTFVGNVGRDKCVIVKGLCVEKWYPSSAPRDFGDFDVVLPDGDDVWDALRVAAEMGFKIEKVRVSLGGDGQLHGIAPAHKYARAGRGWVSCDIHFGGFPSIGGSVVTFEPGEVEVVLGVSGRTQRHTTPTGALIVLAAHTIRQGYARLRELNDMRTIWNLMSRDEREHVMRRATKDGFGNILDALCGARCSPAARVVGALLLSGGAADKRVHGGRRVGLARVVQVLHLAAQYEREGRPGRAWRLWQEGRALWRYGRTYEVWNDVRLRTLKPGGAPVVFAMLESVPSCMSERAWMNVVEGRTGVDVARVGARAVLINPGRFGEVLVTPGGTFVQAAHDGTTDGALCAAAQTSVSDLVTRPSGR